MHLYYVAVSGERFNGFIYHPVTGAITTNVRHAWPFSSFADADEAAKKQGFICYAILRGA